VKGVYGSVDELRVALATYADLVDVVSFDIFDTLVERRFGPPEQVKQLAARLAATAAAGLGLSIPLVRLLALRHEVEADLRARAAAAGLDHECRFSELAGELARRLHAECSPAIAATIVEALLVESELLAEGQALVPKPGMIELLAELRGAGKRVIAVSDMYLDGALLAGLLHRLGFDLPPQAIYVSADAGLGKYSGRLFHHVFRQEQVAPARLLHVGDNPASDWEMPLALGAGALLLRQAERVRRGHMYQVHKWLADRNPFWRGPHLAADLPRSAAGDFFTRYGHDVLGPVFSVFVARVRELLNEGGFDRAFFLAREGDLFLRIHELFDDAGPGIAPAPLHSYLYISRKAVALPAAHKGLSEERLRLFAHHLGQRGLAGLGNALGIEPTAIAGVADALGLPDPRQPMDMQAQDWPAVLAGNAEFQSVIRAQAAAARATLRRYLEQGGFFGAGRRVALVDIGWNGSIQRALRDSFGEDADWPDVHGFYLSFNDNLGHSLGTGEASGILYDRRSFHPRHDILVHYEEIFENGARALHASTVGYCQKTDGRVEPVFRDEAEPDRQAERQFNAMTESLRAGALDYARQFIRRYALFGYSATDLIPYALTVAHRGVFFPTREEAENLFRMIHAEDAGTDSVLDFSAYRLRGPSMLLTPLRVLQAIRTSQWKYGTGRSLGVPGFNHLLRVAHRLMLMRDLARAGRPRPALMQLPTARWWELLLLWITQRGGLPLILRARDAVRRR